MDFVNRFSGNGSAARPFSPETVFKFTDLSPRVQKHLQKVYVTLAGALLLSAVGSWVSLTTGLGGWLGAIGFLVCTTWLLITDPVPSQLNKRYALLGGAAFSQGLTLGPLIDAALNVNPGVLVTAFLGTSAVFACFSLASMVARRRSYLFLGGALSSAISIFTVMRLATWVFGGGMMLFEAELYLGLAVFVGYVLFDTQVIIEQAYAEGAAADHIKAALNLFVDFVAIFVRLLIILLRNAEQRDDEDSSKSRRKKSSFRR